MTTETARLLKDALDRIGTLTAALHEAEDALETIQIQATGIGYEVAHRYFVARRCLRCGLPEAFAAHANLMLRDMVDDDAGHMVARHRFAALP